ncbi:tetratricopeptide repeat protein [Nonomuraea sp. NEAU-A123]|uniref:tetratricopeptide repeat protein n=1 Tax=Nonomuraea sp. NEAU-A123 TaxID=2839649 RepID=UPI001BE3E6E6|nr:tetratricopeptide repeat protein [Nonomuraea sp. NEAU-A123]MBT2224786.1 tetratricopeptide repeat protein [Nonomuraea sp. NEAU-A123]
MDRPSHRLGAECFVEVYAGHDGLLPLSSLLLPAREPLPPDCPDWPLLTPDHAVVPFLGRDEERAALRAWADNPSPLSIAVLTGAGGMGKTRLAGELCTELTAVGWEAGFLPDPRRATGLDVLRPTLLALDHPEPSAAAIGELVRHLAGQRHRPRVRILLLTRESTDGEWWRRLCMAADPSEGLLPITVQLGRRPLTAAERVAHAAAAMRAFAPPRAVLPDVGDPGYDDPLRLQLAALMRLRGDDVAADGELLSRFLMYELDQWMTVWPDGHEPVDAATARQAVALVTLTTPTREELHELLSAVPQAHDRRLALGDWLTRLFPGTSSPLPPVGPGGTEAGLAPLGPEVVAEQLLAETEGLAALVLAIYDHPARTAGHLVQMLDVLRLSSERPAVRSALRSLLTGRLGDLLEAAAEPSAGVGDEHGTAIRSRLGDQLDAALRSQATLAELRVGHLRAGGDRIALAGALVEVTVWLVAVGRVGEAQEASAEAAEIFAATLPYEQAEGVDGRFEEVVPYLVSAVEALEVAEERAPLSGWSDLYESLGECLDAFVRGAVAAGDSEVAGAELGVRVFRRLAAVHPDRYRGRLGLALGVLGDLEYELGRPGTASVEQAIDLLGDAVEDEERGMLVRSLCVYARALLGRHRSVEALAHVERAADLCDELDEPVVAAMTYAVLGATLAALDRPRDALEAITWSQAEQQRARVALLPVQARAAQLRGMVLHGYGRQQEAMVHLTQAVNTFQKLPPTPARLLLAAEAATVLVDGLLADGRTDEAIGYAREAVAVYDGLLAEGVDAAGVHTGRAVAGMSLGAALALQGRHADSVRPLGEAVAALERFAAGDPVLKGQLAKGMLMLGDALIEAGRALEASVVLHRGTQVIEDDLLSAVAHAQLGFCRTELGHHEAAEDALRTADRLLRGLLLTRDSTGDGDLGAMLGDVLRGRLELLKQAGHTDEAAQVERDLGHYTSR